MGLSLLFAVVVSQASPVQASPVQAMLASVESHYRGLGTFAVEVTTSTVPYVPTAPVPKPKTGELTVQNPSMMAYVSDDGWEQVAIDGRRFRTIVRASARAPSLFEAFDVSNARVADRIWTYVAKLFAGPGSLVDAINMLPLSPLTAPTVSIFGVPRNHGSAWRHVRIEIDSTKLEVTKLTFQAASREDTVLTFGPARQVPAVSLAAFVLSPP